MGRFDFLKAFVEKAKPPDFGAAGVAMNWFAPVTKTEVEGAEALIGERFPESVREFFLEIGAGFLKTSRNGKTVRNHPNRVLDPEEAVSLLKGESELTPSEGFDEGEVPIFEVGDGVFLVVKPSGSGTDGIYWSYGEMVERDFATFIHRLYFEDPRYFAA